MFYVITYCEFPSFGEIFGDYTLKNLNKRIQLIWLMELELVARTTKMAENLGSNFQFSIFNLKIKNLRKNQETLMEDYRIDEALALFREEVTKLDKQIQDNKPWEDLAGNKEFLETTLNKTLYLIDLFSWV